MQPASLYEADTRIQFSPHLALQRIHGRSQGLGRRAIAPGEGDVVVQLPNINAYVCGV